MTRDPRLETAHLATEPKRCSACRAETWIMLHHWQGGDPKRVRRTVMCGGCQGTIDRCSCAS